LATTGAFDLERHDNDSEVHSRIIHDKNKSKLLRKMHKVVDQPVNIMQVNEKKWRTKKIKLGSLARK